MLNIPGRFYYKLYASFFTQFLPVFFYKKLLDNPIHARRKMSARFGCFARFTMHWATYLEVMYVQPGALNLSFNTLGPVCCPNSKDKNSLFPSELNSPSRH